MNGTRMMGETMPVSIGTALVFESPNFNIEKWVPSFYVNVKTLYRNLIGAYSEDTALIDASELYNNLLSDMDSLEEAVSIYTKGKSTVYFYLPTYAGITKVLPAAKFKVPTTNNQIVNRAHELMVFNNLKHDIETQKRITLIDTIIPYHDSPTNILTHFAVDLLSNINFPRLTLVESWTGKMKGKAEWNTKLTNGKFLKKLPFNAFTLQIFGDNGNLLSPAPPTLRRAVLRMAEKNTWTPLTTMDKIKYSIGTYDELDVIKELNKYL